MPCKYLVTKAGTVVLERWTGTVGIKELMEHKQQLAGDASIKPGASVLSDCRQAEFELSADAVKEVSDYEVEADDKAQIRRYAFVVNSDTFERAQQFASRVGKSGKTVIVFSFLDVAGTWLGLEIDELQQLMQGIES